MGGKLARAWLHLAAGIALIGASIHLAALPAGPRWYRFFGAPLEMVRSAEQGTWLAPVGAVLIAGAMALCAAYAYSALGRLPRLPLLRLGLGAIGAAASLRAVLVVPLFVWRPELISVFEIAAAVVWLVAGLGYLLGMAHVHGQARPLGHRTPHGWK
ncbi:hypothetical protein [Chromobacterium sp. IIBBL 290-4]|uniref:hypothetical protein n=1 Tax=Chromobacterium sp. IIBBL 290-4 TaxID=2953890 RepID=UPI0020B69BF3|nr:hypothetical protein [Chromobacterium sp. IIBBL 290-4]UTH74627.1 hypothetical protein NKT35_00475 [Chromobacterium sp. IIBBL 290-4]